jgi:hypothetical protein
MINQDNRPTQKPQRGFFIGNGDEGLFNLYKPV